ncbi:MAG: metallophosphoesterase [Candidatus Kerfeldbacteria bacterium]|nr:metallophosphoesterase [Candidatus Kerfeldbacteria bacterium]
MKISVRASLVVLFFMVVAVALIALNSSTIRKFANYLRPNANEQLIFAVIGDTEGHIDTYRQLLALAKTNGAAFVIHVGDVSADGSNASLDQMREVAAAQELPVYTVPGNHDIRVDPTRQTFAARFNKVNFAFEASGFRFALLDNADRQVGFSDQTLAWLADDLAQHRQATYVLAFHRPFGFPLSSIVGDDETPPSRAANNQFLSIISRAQVAAIFSGHLHIYLPYKLNSIPAYITGGGGGDPQPELGRLGQQANHLLLVKVRDGRLRAEPLPLR